ncbi:MAG: methylated-DNA--[protein]-cysteine S-methyltransferase [Silicimonas sp.]|nr:methylated-DNA--[protein]-cysteine S-methyltransferase [Silicimonas sp.]
MPRLSLDTPTGPLTITEEEGAITAINWCGGHHDQSPLLDAARAQIDAYFSNDLRTFDLPLRVKGSDFQRQVCAEMLKIPFGDTRTYGEIARALNTPAQPVGQACGANPIPLIIPCHRVLAANSLGGFSGGTGIETKITLLKHEGAASLLI